MIILWYIIIIALFNHVYRTWEIFLGAHQKVLLEERLKGLQCTELYCYFIVPVKDDPDADETSQQQPPQLAPAGAQLKEPLSAAEIFNQQCKSGMYYLVMMGDTWQIYIHLALPPPPHPHPLG